MERKTKMKKFIATFLLIILVVSAVSTTAFAANTTDTYYTIDATESGIFKYTTGRIKEDSTPVYAKITWLGDYTTTVRAQVQGAEVNKDGYYFNCTCNSAGNSTNYVTLTINVNQSIRSLVYENGCSYARLGFQSIPGATGQPVYGWWSPDSSREHTVAS